ncbi:MAG: hypothetical protein RMI43_02185 [Candidatus Caldarchaeum sp.]|nr:hypothetical protein [Candidatus Caldarchaeum sp.]
MEETYEKLLELWNAERMNNELQQIPEQFFEELSNYMGHLRRQIRLSERDSPNTLLKNTELEMIAKLLESLLRLRLRKIIEAAFTQTPAENMLPFEKKTHTYIIRALSHHEAKIRNASASPKSLLAEAEEKSEVVVFLKDFPKFIGEDLRAYGPFKEGDVATIYYANAQALAQKKVVRLIKLI